MRFLILIMLLSLLPISLKAQSMPHTFTDGDIIYADQINENFEYLLGTSKSVSIDCSSSGVGINEAITQGYNHFIISGTCQENIDIDLSNYRSNRVLFFEGANANAVDKIQDNSSGDNNVINIDNGSISVFIINLTISGGNRGINVSDKTMLGVYGSRIEGYKDIGIASWSNTVVDVKNVVVDGGNLGRLGLRIGGNSNGTIKDSTVENNTSDGIGVYSSSDLWIEKTDVQNNSENGIQVFNSGHIYLRDDTLLTNNGNGLSLGRNSSASIKNIEIQSSEKNGLQIDKGSSVWIENSIINGGKKGLRVANNSEAHIYGNMISNFTYSGIQVEDGSVATIGGNNDSDGNSRGNTITGPIEKGIHISSNSQAELFANDISGYSKTGIEVNRNSSVRIGADWDQDTYSTIQRPEYGNTINGAGLTGESVEDWQRGIQVSESSTIQLHRNLIENNSGGGIRVSENSVIELGGGNIIQDNMHTESDGEVDGTGIELRSGSTLEMWSDAQEREPNTITGNGKYAFRAEGSHLDLRGGDDGNTQNNRLVISGHQTGIRASKGSKVTLERVDVQDNSRRGIRISENSILNVYDGGVTITGNGLIGDQCHDDSDYGLKIRDNSLAELDYITVSDNCYGINVDTNSTLEGGWAGNSSEKNYGMIIQGNLKNGIEVRKNSVFEVEYLHLGGSGTNEGNSSEYNDDAIDVSRNSYASIRNSRIEGNFGRAIEVEYNSNIDLDDTVIAGNGIGLDHSDSALSIGNLSMASINRSDISSGTGGGISIWNGSIVRIYETNITVDASLVTDTYSTALNVSNSALELSNYSDSAFALSSSDGSEISMNQSSKLSLSGYTFDKTSSSDDINVYQTQISLSQIPEGQDIKIYLGDDSRLYFNHSFSSEIISQLNCSSGRTVDDVRINMPGIAYLNGNDSTLIGSASTECIIAD